MASRLDPREWYRTTRDCLTEGVKKAIDDPLGYSKHAAEEFVKDYWDLGLTVGGAYVARKGIPGIPEAASTPFGYVAAVVGVSFPLFVQSEHDRGIRLIRNGFGVYSLMEGIAGHTEGTIVYGFGASLAEILRKAMNKESPTLEENCENGIENN